MLDIPPADEPLDRKTFNRHYDHMLKTGKFNPDIIPYLDKYQTRAINELKKALVRISKEQ